MALACEAKRSYAKVSGGWSACSRSGSWHSRPIRSWLVCCAATSAVVCLTIAGCLVLLPAPLCRQMRHARRRVPVLSRLRLTSTACAPARPDGTPGPSQDRRWRQAHPPETLLHSRGGPTPPANRRKMWPTLRGSLRPNLCWHPSGSRAERMIPTGARRFHSACIVIVRGSGPRHRDRRPCG